jgi:TolB protein
MTDWSRWNFECLVVAGLISLTACSIPARQSANSLPSLALKNTPTLPSPTNAEAVPTLTPTLELVPPGKIVFVCQVTGNMGQDQICIMNSNGTGERQLTSDYNSEHFYPSLAPDGKSIVYSANPTGVYELYEMDLQGNSSQLTHNLGTLTAPEISPDGQLIVFSLGDGQKASVWIINRDGSQPRVVYDSGWDPTWSPDGKQLLFASYDANKTIQLFTINLDGSGLKQLTQLTNLRGRSDWSPDGKWAVTYAGEPWGREVYLLPMDGGEPVQLTLSGGNSQGPSFSPDGQWVAFTSYYGAIGNENGCEIYIIRTNGSQLTRLTNNTFCDWQPRWGP